MVGLLCPFVSRVSGSPLRQHVLKDLGRDQRSATSPGRASTQSRSEGKWGILTQILPEETVPTVAVWDHTQPEHPRPLPMPLAMMFEEREEA